MQFPDSISPISPPPPDIESFSTPSPEDPPWSLLDVVLIMAFAFAALVMSLALTLGIVHALPRFHQIKPLDLAENALVLVPAQTVAYLIVVAFMVLLVRSKTSGSFLKAVSWNEPPRERLLIAVAGGIGLALLSSVFTALLSRWMPKSVPIDKLFRDARSAYLLTVFGIIVAPFVEELFFRGFLYPALARRIGVGASVLLTAIAFTLVHQSQLAHAWVPLAWLFIVGVVLTVVRARTKSVATCILIHVAYNTTLFIFFFIATQGFRHLERG